MSAKDIITGLKGRDLLVEGSRNNDSVNLAILAYADEDGEIDDAEDLLAVIIGIIEEEDLILKDGVSDTGYLEEKCKVLMDYLPDWYNTGDIYGYAIN